MNLNLDFTDPKVLVVNIVIILFIALCTYDGYKKGLFETALKFLAFVFSVTIAFLFKGKLAMLMCDHLPFFKLGGVLKGITSLNILIYELVAFLIIFAVCMIVFGLVIKMTSIIDKLIKSLPLIGFVDKLIGAIIGFVESILVLYVVVFVFKFGANLFGFEVAPSLADNILEIPVLQEKFGNSLSSFDDVVETIKDNKDKETKDEMNYDTLEILLKYDVITKENVQKLVDDDKLNIPNVEELFK